MSKKFMKRLRTVERIVTIIAYIVLIASLVLPGAISSAAPKYKSWIAESSAKESSLYTRNELVVANEDAGGRPDDGKPNPLVKMIASIIGHVATWISKGLNELTGVPCNVSSIIMGKVATGKSFFVFDLSTGNIYGIIGSYLYVAMQNLSLSFVFVASLLSLVMSMWKGDSKGGQFLKDNIVRFTGALLLLYLMPLIADAVCNIRDAIGLTMYNIYDNLLNQMGGGASGGLAYVDKIEQDFYQAYTDNENLAEALAYFAVVTIPIGYIIAYVKVAIMQLILFALFPMFIFESFLDEKQSLKQWFVTFFSNCFIPVIDISLIMLPSILLKMLESYGMKKDSFIKVLIVVVMFRAIVPSRNQILKMLGNNWAISNGKGLWGFLGGAAQTAARGIAGAAAIANGIRNGVDRYKEHKEQDAELKEQKDDRLRAADQINAKLGNEIPSYSESRRIDGGANRNPVEEIGERNPIPAPKEEIPASKSDDQRKPTFEDHYNKFDNHKFPTDKDNEGAKQTPELADVPNQSGVSTPVSDEFAVTRNDIMNRDEYKQLRDDVRDGVEFNVDKDFNTDRLANLASMDNINNEVSRIDNENARLNGEIAKEQADLNRQKRIDGALSEGRAVSKEDLEFAKSFNATYGTGAGDGKAADRLQDKISEHKDQIALNNASKQALNLEQNRRSDIEKEYAKANEAVGKSGRVYATAADFANQAKIDARLASSAKLSNFTDKKFDGVLTNQQKIDFQRKAERREMAAKVISFSAKAGVHAGADVAGAMGAAASLSGGTDQEYFSGADISRAGNLYNAGHTLAKSSKLNYDSEAVQSVANAGGDVFDFAVDRRQRREKPVVDRLQRDIDRDTGKSRI